MYLKSLLNLFSFVLKNSTHSSLSTLLFCMFFSFVVPIFCAFHYYPAYLYIFCAFRYSLLHPYIFSISFPFFCTSAFVISFAILYPLYFSFLSLEMIIFFNSFLLYHISRICLSNLVNL